MGRGLWGSGGGCRSLVEEYPQPKSKLFCWSSDPDELLRGCGEAGQSAAAFTAHVEADSWLRLVCETEQNGDERSLFFSPGGYG